jgi:hypothetical protein
MNNFKDFNIEIKEVSFIGEKIKINKLFNREITIIDYQISPSNKKENSNCLKMQIEYQGVKRVIFTGSSVLMEQIKQVPKDNFPFTTEIIMGDNDRYEFT